VGQKRKWSRATELVIALVVGCLWSAGKVTRLTQAIGVINAIQMANGGSGVGSTLTLIINVQLAVALNWLLAVN